MKVYVVSTGNQTLAVCANVTLARKKVFNTAARYGLADPEIESSEDEWNDEFNCCSEDQRTHLAMHRDDYPVWDKYTYTAQSGNKMIFFIEEVEMTGDPVLSALAEIKRELDRVPKIKPGIYYGDGPQEED